MAYGEMSRENPPTKGEQVVYIYIYIYIYTSACVYTVIISLRYVPYMITGSLHIPYKNNDNIHYAHPDSRTLQTINRIIIQTSWLHDYLQSKKKHLSWVLPMNGDIRQPSSEDNKKVICVVLYNIYI